MAKLGERRPWRVRYVWSNGVKGTATFTDEWHARHKAEEIEWRAGVRGLTVTVQVSKRADT